MGETQRSIAIVALRQWESLVQPTPAPAAKTPFKSLEIKAQEGIGRVVANFPFDGRHDVAKDIDAR